MGSEKRLLGGGAASSSLDDGLRAKFPGRQGFARVASLGRTLTKSGDLH